MRFKVKSWFLNWFCVHVKKRIIFYLLKKCVKNLTLKNVFKKLKNRLKLDVLEDAFQLNQVIKNRKLIYKTLKKTLKNRKSKSF